MDKKKLVILTAKTQESYEDTIEQKDKYLKLEEETGIKFLIINGVNIDVDVVYNKKGF